MRARDVQDVLSHLLALDTTVSVAAEALSACRLMEKLADSKAWGQD